MAEAAPGANVVIDVERSRFLSAELGIGQAQFNIARRIAPGHEADVVIEAVFSAEKLVLLKVTDDQRINTGDHQMYRLEEGRLRVSPGGEAEGVSGYLIQAEPIIRRAARLPVGPALKTAERNGEFHPTVVVIDDVIIPAFGAVTIEIGISIVENLHLYRAARIVPIEPEAKRIVAGPILTEPAFTIGEGMREAAPAADIIVDLQCS